MERGGVLGDAETILSLTIYCTVVLVLFYVFVPCCLVIAPSKTKETAILEFV